MSEALKRAVVAHYDEKLKLHGPTARGMDWKDAASQRLRFEVLCGIADLDGRSVHDLGAGAGHLLDFLIERGIRADYSGSDLSKAMVEAARIRHPGVPFQELDVLAGAPDCPTASYDAVVCSGLFHVKLDHTDAEWWGFVAAVVRRMFAMCRLGIAFNLMSDRVDFRSPSLYYANPGEVVDFCCRELSRYVVLRHDYPLYEQTIYVYREPPVSLPAD